MNEAVENGLKVGASEDPFLPDGRGLRPLALTFPTPSLPVPAVRMWAHTITPGHAIQSAPGVWNEDILRGMDFILARRGSADSRSYGASVRRDSPRPPSIRDLTFSNLRRASDARRRAVADNWYPVGGIDQYVEWSPTASRHQDFFTDVGAFELYENTFETLANRVNSITGVAYKDDPTIMAWNLANEARCQGCDSRVMQSWIERVCASFKARDPNHLVGIGYEGSTPEQR